MSERRESIGRRLIGLVLAAGGVGVLWAVPRLLAAAAPWWPGLSPRATPGAWTGWLGLGALALGGGAAQAMRRRGAGAGRATAVGLAVALAIFGTTPLSAVPGASVAAMVGHGLALAALTAGLQLATTGAFGRLALAAWTRLLALPGPLFLGGAMLLGFGLAFFVSLHLFRGAPVLGDGLCYLLLAELITHGRVCLPQVVTPDLMPFFALPLTGHGEAGWFIQHPPGFAVLLAPGVAAGVPHLVNPFLHAVLVAMVLALGREAGGRATARGATLLAAASPLLAVYAGTFFAHTASAVLLTGFAAAFLRARRRGGWAAAAAGFLAGGAFATRPYSALLVALPFLGAGLVALVRRPRIYAPRLMLFAIGAAAPIVLLLLYHRATTGDALLFGYEAVQGAGHRLGFGLRGFHNLPLVPFTPGMGLVQTQERLVWLQDRLTSWPVPIYLLVVAALAARTRGRPRRLLFAAILCVAAGHGAYFYRSTLLLDARFLLECVPLALVLVAAGLGRMPGRPATRAAVVAVAVVLALAVRAPIDFLFYRTTLMPDRNRLDRALEALEGRRGVFFFEGHLGSTRHGIAADPFLERPLLLAAPGGRADDRLRAAFPDRSRAWYLAGEPGGAVLYEEVARLEDLSHRPPPGPHAPRTRRHLDAVNRLVRIAPGRRWRFRLDAPEDGALVFGRRTGGPAGAAGTLTVRVNGRSRYRRTGRGGGSWSPRDGFLALDPGPAEIEFAVDGTTAVAVVNPDLIRARIVRRFAVGPVAPLPLLFEP